MTFSPSESKARRPRLPFLDFAKGLAVLSVAAVHYVPWADHGRLAKISAAGGLGVHVFVLLSGFGLAVSSRSLDLRSYYFRRVRRVYVPYALTIAIVFALNLRFALYPNDGVYALLGHLFLFKMFDESIIQSLGEHTWFVSLILQFYLVYPLMRAAAERFRPAVFVAGAGCISLAYAVATVLAGVSEQRTFNSSLFTFLWAFALGISAGRKWLKGELERPAPTTLLVAVAVGGILLAATMRQWGGEIGRALNDIPGGLGYFAFLALVYRVVQKGPRALIAAGVAMGGISYEFYLWHEPVLRLLGKIFRPDPTRDASWALLAFALLVSIAVATAFRALVARLDRAPAKARPDPALPPTS
jgi:peptidoglycan/LPS O-acetylase OafA/YrhL